MPKKPRLNEMEFIGLNDDCIRQILWKLTASDLCSMSFTCERLQRLAFDHYPRQYPDKKITIAMCSPKTAYIRNADKHMKYFAKCIPNIRIDSPGPRANIQCLFDFVHTECCAELRTLELSIAGRVKACHIEVIKSNLETLSTLHIHEPFGRYDIYDVLLQHCKKLQHLIIMSTDSFDSSWMQHAYPTLTKVTFNFTSDKQIRQFVLLAKTFIRLNPQIKQFTCYDNDIVKSVLTNATTIEVIEIRHSGWNQLQPLVDIFQERGKHNAIKALRLSIGPHHETLDNCNALKILNAIQPVHSLSCFLFGLTGRATFMSQFKFLEELYLHVPPVYGNEDELLTILSEQLTNMQDLRLNFNGRDRMFKSVAMKFVKNSLKMKFLNFVMCHNNTFIFHPNDLVTLNECRSSPLRCAVPIKIRLDYDKYDDFEKPTFIQPAKSVMSITFVSMWRDDE